MGTKLEIHGREAIELMKQTYPKSWEEKIQEKAAMLKRMQKTWKHDKIEDTYTKYMNYVGSAASSIEMLAALQTIKDNEQPVKSIHDQIKEVIANQDKVLLQQEALESSNTNEFDKRTLRQFYNTKQAEYAAQLTELTNAIEVVEPCVLIIQGDLFKSAENQ